MTDAAPTREVRDVSLALIDAPPLPSRSTMDDTQLDALVESIRAIGLQQPLIVASVGDRFEVIAGHRRKIACERAGLVSVFCIVYPSKDIPRLAIQAHENSRREDLNPAEEAVWFMELLERECGGDIDRLCGLVGEKLSYVDNRIALFRGDPLVFDALRQAQIKLGVAHELNKCPDEKYRRYYLDCAVRSGATVTTVVGWLQEWHRLFHETPQAPAAPAPAEPSLPDDALHPFTCEICGRHDNVHLIRQMNVHQHCKLAILDPLLAQARGDT